MNTIRLIKQTTLVEIAVKKSTNMFDSFPGRIHSTNISLNE